jgi:two-component system NtrC family response regulator
VYGAAATLPAALPGSTAMPLAPSSSGPSWRGDVVRSDVAALRDRLASAAALIASGRHEPGVRLLRHVIGGLSRRGDWEGAARGGLRLSGAWLARGRPRDAQGAMLEARDALCRAGADAALWVEAAVLAGVIRLDLGAAEEAESILQGAIEAARAAGDSRGLTSARLAQGRCLFWRGRHDEAAEAVAGLHEPEAPAVVAVRALGLRARASVGQGDLGGAVGYAQRAIERAEQHGEAVLLASAWYAAAFTHAAVGDTVAMRRDIAACLGHARRGRDPLRTIRARLLAVAHDPQLRSTAVGRGLLQRLARFPSGSLPSTIRARCALLAAAPVDALPRRAGGAVPDALRQQIASTGLRALALFVPAGAPPRRGDEVTTQEIVDILHCCQEAGEGVPVVTAVAARLRAQLGAVAVACVSPTGLMVAADGGRIERQIVDRVQAVGQTIAPHVCEGVLEGGAPVRYGGKIAAALVARWAVGTRVPLRAAATLTLAAAALAPAVAEALSSRDAARRHPPAHDIAGVTEAIGEVRRAIERTAAAPFPVLIEGESGSGKELVARAIHRASPRRERPFCALNCAALPDDLVESELFGHARGAFTGAVAERPGIFEEAHGGTLFLDEIGELSPRAQAKLLRTIQDGELRRVGEQVPRRVDVRIVAATHRDLRIEAGHGRFRHDLMYRLDVIRIVVPPLRARRDDIAELAERFWREATARLGSRATLQADTVSALTAYDWPGNVRELQNVIASLAVRSPRRGVVPPSALPAPFQPAAPLVSLRLDDARRAFDERFIRAALVRTAGRRHLAARQLGVSRQGLAKLMARLGIE